MKVNIKLGREKGRICDLIYGQFIEHALSCIDGGIYDPENILSDENGIRKDVVSLTKEIAPTIIRFPGGTVSCQYHFEDSIGAKEGRKTRKNLIWGGEIDPGFGTCEFIKFCRLVGAEPMISVNIVSGTPEEAGNWVEYCNGTGNTYYAGLRRKHGFDEPFNVKYWCIGNESFAEPDMGKHHNVRKYIEDAKEFIKRMKLTDDSIKIVVVGCDNKEWNEAVLDELSDFTDYISLHFYSSTKGRNTEEAYKDIDRFRSVVETTQKIIDKYPAKPESFNRWYRFSPRKGPIKIAVDEWNIWNADESKDYGLLCDYSWEDALWCACMLSFFINTQVIEIANMAQLVNVLAPIKTTKVNAVFQPIAIPLIWFKKSMVGERMEIISDSDLSICAVKNDNKMIVSVVNNLIEEVEVQAGVAFTKTVILSKEGEKIGENTLDKVVIPPKSICFMET